MARIIKYLLFIGVFITCMSSCNTQNNDTKDVIPNNAAKATGTTDGKIEVRDSVYQELTSQVKALTFSLDSINTELNSLDSKIKDNEKSVDVWRIIAVIAIVFAVIALFFAIYTNMHCIFKDRIDSLIKRNNDLVKRMIEERIHAAVAKNPQKNKTQTQSPPIAFYSMPEFKELEKRISALEEAIKNNNSTSRNNNEVTVQPSAIKVGYAKTNSNNKFTEVMPSNKEGCVYKIKFINDNEGEFDLIELSMLQQTPNYKDVVEIVDGCPLSEAKNYEAISLGKCKKIVSGINTAWKVTEKLKIKTLR